MPIVFHVGLHRSTLRIRKDSAIMYIHSLEIGYRNAEITHIVAWYFVTLQKSAKIFGC